MTAKITVAMIDNAFLAAEFATIAARAAAAGFAVVTYPDNHAFHAADHAATDAVLCMGSTQCDAGAMDRMPRLRALLSAVTGIEGFDMAAAESRTIIIGNGQTALNYTGMAESTVLLMLAALYDFNGTQTVLRENRNRPSPLRARLLKGRTIGFIGFGKIAQETARRLAAWDVRMVAAVHRPNPHMATLDVEPMELDTLLATADIVSLHCSLNLQTHHLLDRHRLGMMKRDAFLINTARGALIDEVALIEVLRNRRIAGAALDTFEVEPLPADSGLRDLPNVILTPHMIGHTNECNVTLMETAWQSILNVARGEPPVFVKNPDILERWRARFAALTS